jgi:hypothetical protein
MIARLIAFCLLAASPLWRRCLRFTHLRTPTGSITVKLSDGKRDDGLDDGW